MDFKFETPQGFVPENNVLGGNYTTISGDNPDTYIGVMSDL